MEHECQEYLKAEHLVLCKIASQRSKVPYGVEKVRCEQCRGENEEFIQELVDRSRWAGIVTPDERQNADADFDRKEAARELMKSYNEKYGAKKTKEKMQGICVQAATRNVKQEDIIGIIRELKL